MSEQNGNGYADEYAEGAVHEHEDREDAADAIMVNVTPGPTQFSVDVAHTADGQGWLTIRCNTPYGVQVYFCEPQHALTLAKMIAETAARASLAVAPKPKLIRP